MLLPSLLALYVAARVLQLFADRIPSLFIVSLHVVPAALFSLIHGSRVYGLRGILIFMALCLGIGSAFESLSLRTGFPFGHYAFTEVMGPKLFDLPILLALAYVGMGYVSWILGLTILGYRDQLFWLVFDRLYFLSVLRALSQARAPLFNPGNIQR